MNCTIVHRRLLSAEQPDQPTEDLKNHLAQCPSCRAWQRRLVQMERQIPLLPIPRSTAKDRFLQRLAGTYRDETGQPALADSVTLLRSPLMPGPKERALRKISLAFALAASLLVFALAWWSWPHDPRSAPETAHQQQIRQEQVRLEERLKNSLRAETPTQRVLLVVQLAEEVHGEARTLADNTERLEQRAQFYTRLVGEHLIEQARQLPAKERALVLQKAADSLREAESSASRWEARLQKTAPRSAASFRRIALASRNGERDLRTLLNG